MFTIARPFLLHAVTSVHAGSGSEIGTVDLPIQREKHTGYPKIESSSLKGALRHDLAVGIKNKPEEQEKFKWVFGSKPQEEEHDNESQASALSFIDARILLFPVRSLRGTFAWITCRNVLERFNREMTLLCSDKTSSVPQWPLEGVEPETTSSQAMLVGNRDKIVLEEYTMQTKQSGATQSLAERIAQSLGADVPLGIKERLVVLTDDQFADFVKMSTEINARIKVGDSGTTDRGLWYEENVPPETVFYSAVLIGQVRESNKKGADTGEDRMGTLTTDEDVRRYVGEHFPSVFQLGGSNTIGKGILRLIWLEGGAGHDKTE
ncbi:type III-B CRISPR module RAMP protein Cmr4 [Methylomusa anaerophila]|uniref:RAMP superfamily protein n=1 Tax=Methylomusa anaerophila TaxID=1930071 RepID=A0A348AQY7_9FIRM|nr:type III-B CRISPR module RAMP protein Cmr4 [Methylomusa anaerophila]BBB93485.1 RAMP superfamily protein [Methylomusa anaerophila]